MVRVEVTSPSDVRKPVNKFLTIQKEVSMFYEEKVQPHASGISGWVVGFSLNSAA